MLSTTDLLVEHIISGFLSLIWIFAFITCFVDIDLSMISVIADYWIILAILITSMAYPIGISLDTIADKLLTRWDNKLKKKIYTDPGISIIKVLHELQDSNATNYFTYNRFKIRVSRSAALNFLLIGILFPFSLTLGRTFRDSFEQNLALSLVVFLLFFILTLLSLFVWRESSITLYERTQRFWDEIKSNKS